VRELRRTYLEEKDKAIKARDTVISRLEKRG
jgi:hypothetical protein